MEGRMAQRLLRSWLMAGLATIGMTGLAAAAGAACILPLPFEQEFDAGPGDDNYPPVIVESVPPMPGFLTLEAANPLTHTLNVKDKDQDDDIFVRVFRNYDPLSPTPPLSMPTVPGPSPDAVRTVQLSTATWCSAASPATTYTFLVLVADRQFLSEDIAPAYQALPEGAESSRLFWIGTCE
jgi:hypothetical protein